ncbi:MAG TPA: hypothetical protein VFX16_28835, partial [Pseudonocardiaceae bacterium]|nr:hypothetical protein [Pseudonocardiaceae bacterium]
MFTSRMVPIARVAEGHYDSHVLDHMQAATRVALELPERIAGVVLTASTELPVAAGLSSSAALCLAAVTALDGLDGGRPDITRACRVARRAEAGDLASGAGWMDFLGCAHGGVNRINAGDVPTVERIAPSLDIPVVVIDTLQRRTTTAVLASKRARFWAREPAMVDYCREAGDLVVG